MKLPRFPGGAKLVDEIRRRAESIEIPTARIHVKHNWRHGFRRTEVLAIDEQTGRVPPLQNQSIDSTGILQRSSKRLRGVVA